MASAPDAEQPLAQSRSMEIEETPTLVEVNASRMTSRSSAEVKEEREKNGPSRIVLLVNIVLTLVIIVTLSNVMIDPEHENASLGLAVLLIQILWWVTEVVPLTVSSLFPVVTIPLLGIGTAASAMTGFFGGVSCLLIAGFFMGLAVERWGLHKRAVIYVVGLAGTKIQYLVGAFMLVVFILSMFISNVASTLCVLPVVQIILDAIPKHRTNLRASILLSIMYAASLGGMVTTVGTPTNTIFVAKYNEWYGEQFSFTTFMLVAGPLAVILNLIIWGAFTLKNVVFSKEEVVINMDSFKDMQESLGKFSFEEMVVTVFLVVLTLLWATQNLWDVSKKAPMMPWGIGLFVTLILFLLPCGSELPVWLKSFLGPERCESHSLIGEKPKNILDWDMIKHVFSWEILFVVGGGDMVAKALTTTQFVDVLAKALGAVASNQFALIAVVTVLTCFTTEVVSNASTFQILGPVVATAAHNNNLNQVQMLLTVCLAASFSFMLPTASGPNLVVYNTGEVSVKTMATRGLAFNLTGCVVCTLYMFAVAPLFLGSAYDGLGAPFGPGKNP